MIITGRRQSKLDEAKAQFPKLHIIQSDVASTADIADLAADVKARFPRLDVLMNNAGIFLPKNLRSPAADLEGLMAEMNINFGGTVRMTSAFIGLLTANKGTIINVSSGLAFAPLTGAPLYCATKAALHSYTISLRYQLEGTGVRVIELMPPAVKTELSEVPESIKVISTDELVAASVKALKAGEVEIRVGQSNQLHWMSRIAPGFINGELHKGSKGMIPPAEG